MSFFKISSGKLLTIISLLAMGYLLPGNPLQAQDHTQLHNQMHGAAPSTEPTGLSPYSGMERRHIKALSPEDIQGLMRGQGMGFAMAAELNRYPGPRHVLDLAQGLSLTEAQRQDTEALFQRMQSQAIALGSRIVQGEESLDRLFAEGTIDTAQLERLTSDIASLRGKLRAVHLAAHLEMTALLTPEQVSRYQQLRGYTHASSTGESPMPPQAGGKHPHR